LEVCNFCSPRCRRLAEGMRHWPRITCFCSFLNSLSSALDPRDFISKLGLDPDVQQDAQEFNKLFLMLLESSLSSQSNSKVRNIVQSQFGGNYAYVTTCSKCKRESRSPSQFSELLLAVQVHSVAFMFDKKIEVLLHILRMAMSDFFIISVG
jgi:hypothetical protein